MTGPDLLNQPLRELQQQYPHVEDFLASHGLTPTDTDITLGDFFAALDAEQLSETGVEAQDLPERFLDFMRSMEAFLHTGARSVQRITLVGGRDKDGREDGARVDLERGEVICVVGPTGSGKSRLLADIECLAQGDTPTGRTVLLDGAPVDEATRLSGEQRLVAQLSQNMNFVMDLSVREFLQLHAESCLVEDPQAVASQIFSLAVDLAGEPFTELTPVTALSGGQSRALMIADVACLSASPIVLIDEIENAGVDRRRALELLVRKEKIVLIATHDPLMALSGDRRLVIRNGAVAEVVETTAEERRALLHLDRYDRRLAEVREDIRQGKRIDFDVKAFLEG